MTITATAVNLVDTWLASVVGGDAYLTTLGSTGVYNGVAVDGAIYPLITFANLSGKDVITQGGLRVMSQQTYVITVFAQSAHLAAQQIAARIDALVTLTYAVPWSTGWILSCLRLSEQSLTSVANGVRYREIKQTYQIRVQGG